MDLVEGHGHLNGEGIVNLSLDFVLQNSWQINLFYFVFMTLKCALITISMLWKQK